MIKSYNKYLKIFESTNSGVELNIKNELVNLLINSDSKFAKGLLKIKLFKQEELKDNYANFLDFDEITGMITYMPNDKASGNTLKYGYNEVKYRSSVRPTKIISKIFKDPNIFYEKFDIKQSDIEIFSNLLTSNKDYKIEIWEGEKLLEAFNYTKRLNKGFSKSCANFYQKELDNTSIFDEPKKNWFDVYVENPDNIKVVVIIDKNDIIIGRRLLFKGIQFEDNGEYKKDIEYTILSNFYYGVGGEDSKYDIMIKKWAMNKKYYISTNRPSGYFLFKIKNWKYPQYPPFDSAYIEIDRGILSFYGRPYMTGNWKQCYKLKQQI